MFKSIWTKPVTRNDDATQAAAQDPGLIQSTLQSLNLPRKYWHDKLGSFYKDQFNPKDGFVQHVHQTVSMPKRWILDLIDEGKPEAVPLTAEELERAATWARFLEPVSEGAKAHYAYQSLGSMSTLSTRLVRLLPGEDLEDIQVMIDCVELDSCASYEALSYCWGDPSVKTGISCDGSSLHVTKNLKSALLYLRSRTEERLLWIDAVSINQEDLQERSQQVGIMRDIYQNASRTVVWLGEENQNSGLGIELCEKIYEFFEDERKDQKSPEMQFNYRRPWAATYEDRFNPSSGRTDEGDFDKRVRSKEITEGGEIKKLGESNADSPLRMNPPNVYELLALRDLARRQWFRRIWIAQELALSSTAIMVCGHRSITWDTFIFGFTTTFINGESASGGWDDEDNFIGALVQIRDWVHRSESVQYKHPVTFLDLLHDCRIFEATDPRDKVYGLLGVAPPNSEAAFVPVDYSNSVEEVYEYLACLILSSSRNLDLLSVPRANSKFGESLPSWVPDWSHTSSLQLALVFPAGQSESVTKPMREFAASQGSTVTPAFRDPHVLVLSGHFVDSITQLSEIIQPPVGDQLERELLGQKLDERKYVLEDQELASTSLYFDVMMSIEDMALGSGDDSLYPTGEPRTRALWRTLCTDIASNNLEAAEQVFTSWRKALMSPRLLKKYRVDKFTSLYSYFAAVGYGLTNVMNDCDGLFFALMQPALYSRFAITKMGYFALVPPATKLGDQVGLFRGGKVPLIIRQERNKQFRLVGESYVHGIMQGEAFDETKREELDLI